MKKYLSFNLPKELKTYFALFLATITTIIVITIFLQISEFSQHFFKQIIVKYPLYGLLTPFVFVTIVLIVRKYFGFASGSGIPQTLAALGSHNKSIRANLLSIKATTFKMLFIFVGTFFGASIGIQGPSVYIGSAIFYNFARFIKLKRKVLIHAFLTIGSSLGLLVVFNSPLAAISFAFEEIGKNLKKQAKALIVIIITLTFLLLIFIRDDSFYLGDFRAILFTDNFDFSSLFIFVPLVLICGIMGGIFTKLTLVLIKNITHKKAKFLSIVFILGSIVAALNYLSDGLVAGSGHDETVAILNGANLDTNLYTNLDTNFGIEFVVMKFLATLSSIVAVIPGGLFMPNITIGAGIGSVFYFAFESVEFILNIDYQIIVIFSMVAYLSAIIRTPFTASLVILEITNSLNLLIPALIIALISNYISSKIQRQSLFYVLAQNFDCKKIN
jgi:H+/Cl- antiporter ClcA